MNNFIPLSVPNLRGNELKYVTEAIESEWVSTGGAFITRLESELARYLHTDQAVALQSGTAGLHLALQLAGVGPEHEVLVPTLTFIAAVNPIRYQGAQPIFMDCDESLCLDPQKLEAFCQSQTKDDQGNLVNSTTGKIIKAIVVVHVFGNMADMAAIMEIARKYRLWVIEDATEALGTRYETGPYEGKFAGTMGDFGVFSFNGNKIITTGGGGAMVSTHPELLAKAKYLSTQAKNDELYFVHNEIGYNYRMTNLQAAVGIAQLEQLDAFIEIKKRNYELYKELLTVTPGVELWPFRENISSNHWFYTLVIDEEKTGISRDALMGALSEEKIQSRPVWKLIHSQKPYAMCQRTDLSRAEFFEKTILNIPCSTNLNEPDVHRVAQTITRLVRGE
ncbi:LegC family aminotransferase [Myxococcota bacterium]|nr:LegC family aminotransferase [Myxococcota bacterium]MBU1534253.1 LegC family aminotransferase [Myxococcota bacterium]